MTADTLPLPRLVVLLLLLGACGPADHPAADTVPPDSVGVVLDSAQATHVRTAPAESISFHPTIEATGTVLFNGERSTAVVSPISGPVSRLAVSLGREVHPGQVLATVTSADFAAAIADFRKADAAWQNASRIAELNEKLLATGALPRAERDQSASDLVEATADRAASLAALAAVGLDDSTLATIDDGRVPPDLAPAIRAPIAGTVVERLITPGQLLEAGATPAFTIADLGSMWVDASVFAGDVARVRVGDSARVTSDALSDTLTGAVTYVGALVDPTTRATAVRILVPNRGRLLRQNMLVHVTITSATSRSGVLVPVSAVLRDDENLPYLFVAQGEGRRFDRRRITLGERVGDRYEVVSGLHRGEPVVTEGGLYLSEAGAP
jgi:cobalt-zinc-cadmium efflux system membrane fusion protein